MVSICVDHPTTTQHSNFWSVDFPCAVLWDADTGNDATQKGVANSLGLQVLKAGSGGSTASDE